MIRSIIRSHYRKEIIGPGKGQLFGIRILHDKYFLKSVYNCIVSAISFYKLSFSRNIQEHLFPNQMIDRELFKIIERCSVISTDSEKWDKLYKEKSDY